jgi:hypothetical protein
MSRASKSLSSHYAQCFDRGAGFSSEKLKLCFLGKRPRFPQLSNTADGFALHQCADHGPGRLIDPEQSHNHRIALNRSI